MQAGLLRDRIKVERRSQSQDGYGAPVDSWNELFSDWARVEDLGGREFFAPGRVAADVDVRITLRYRADVLPRDRITSSGKIYDIQNVIADPRKTTLHLMCKRAA